MRQRWDEPRAAQPPQYQGGGRRGFWETDEDGFSRHVQPPRRRPTRPPPLIGKGKQNRLQVVKMQRKCNIFVSRLAAHTTEDDLSKVVEDIINVKPLQIEKLRTRYTSYASFRVTAAEEHREALLCIDAWGEGTLARNYYIPRKINVLNPKYETN